LIEARDVAKNAAKAQGDIEKLSNGFDDLGAKIKKAFAAYTAFTAAKFAANASDELLKFNEQMETLGQNNVQTAASFDAVLKTSAATGQSVHDVAEVYKAATEATEQLGGSQKDAAELAEAFTKAAVKEGKSAATAAAQLDTLQFAYDRGGVKVKEFNTLLKDNEQLQQSAERALGKTTEELMAMAKAGDIGREELRKIFAQFRSDTASTEVAATFDRIGESLKTMGKAFVTATAQASGFADAMKMGELAGIVEFFSNIGKIIGGLIRVVWNFAEGLVNIIRLIAQIIVSPKDILSIWDKFNRAQDENYRDMLKGVQQFGEAIGTMDAPSGVSKVHKTHSEIAAEANERVRMQAEAEEKARVEAENKRRAAEEQREREKDAKYRADTLAARAEQARIKEGMGGVDDALNAQFGDKLLEDQNTIINNNNTILAQKNEEGRLIMKNAASVHIQAMAEEEFLAANQKNLEDLSKVSDTIGNAFYNLFTGATKSAKEFFREILRGFAQIAAARLASSIADSIFNAGSKWFSAKKAKGGAFTHGYEIPFASGGVVTGPTSFAMGGGRTGLMGEAGAEAIMPLRRGRDGRLGVSGGSPNIQIVNNTGVAADASVNMQNDRMQIVLEAANMGARMAERRINRSLRTGYGDTAQSIQRTYGLGRRF